MWRPGSWMQAFAWTERLGYLTSDLHGRELRSWALPFNSWQNKWVVECCRMYIHVIYQSWCLYVHVLFWYVFLCIYTNTTLYFTLYYTISYHIIARHIISYYSILYHSTSYYSILCRVVLLCLDIHRIRVVTPQRCRPRLQFGGTEKAVMKNHHGDIMNFMGISCILYILYIYIHIILYVYIYILY